MKIKSIKYNNYRCFLDATIKFDTTKEKNIALIVGPNGGGKTEMLFSFWWVLYGFDFSSLHGKEQTPYSLNSTLYQNLENGRNNDSASCAVELSFEEAGVLYVVRKEETFTKVNNKISSTLEVELATYQNGSKSLPETDREKVEQRLLRIVPINVLHGIIFDGERMKQLSSNTDSAKIAVEGVIKEITNEELFSLISTDLAEIKADIASTYKKLGKKQTNLNLNHLIAQIQKLENDIEASNIILDADKKSLEDVLTQLSLISKELENLKEISKYAKDREKKLGELKRLYQKLKESEDTFAKDMASSYLLLSNKLFDDVQNNLDDIDIPAGLTVEAVESILKRTHCICGAELTGDIRTHLNELIGTLPPDNINSTLSEMTRQMRMNIKDESETIKRSYKSIVTYEKEIIELKAEISQLSVHITTSDVGKSSELEEQYQNLFKEKLRLEAEIDKLEKDIAEKQKLLETLKRQRESESKNNDACQRLNMKEAFVLKCIKAIKAIGEYNKMQSLKEINSIINDSYEKLSEDAIRGRKLYIIGHDKKKKYLMLSYFQEKYDNMLKLWRNTGEIDARVGMTEEEISEEIKIKVSESNSTGQSKVNSLAFAKSILDFSSKQRNEEEMYLTKSYPFFIDSPFTELDRDNQILTAKNINTFAEQVILMASEQSMLGVNEFIQPYVGCKAEFFKNETDNFSTIKQY